MSSAKASAENKLIAERAKVDYCEANSTKIKSVRRGEHNSVKKLDLTWKSRMLLFQNSSWELGKSEKAK